MRGDAGADDAARFRPVAAPPPTAEGLTTARGVPGGTPRGGWSTGRRGGRPGQTPVIEVIQLRLAATEA
ncbi:hypothetical protein AWW66_23745 [Micromonospora rosaria]|uniref:Uncharacterized protein n=1 Tax=Micromonospora rosaria TaxID=47874 RepID=A0A136PMB4_9ACTN|nr:hypothetical protein AWW66_23745 [Micromonospora rosaria]